MIKQILSGDIVDSLYNANTPTASNPVATISDLIGTIPNQNAYLFSQNFNLGVIPPGWTQSTATGTVSYTQAYETGAIGQAYLSAGGPGATRASLRFATAYNHILRFNDCVTTKWNFYSRRGVADNGFCLVGLTNTGTSTPTGFGNTIALIHDPLNQSGMNPGLLTNWLVCVRLQAGTYTTYDTSVAPTGIWQFIEFEYNNVTLGSHFLEVKINNALVATVLASDPNLFVATAPAANVALSPTLYCGTVVGAAATNTLRTTFFNLYRKWN